MRNFVTKISLALVLASVPVALFAQSNDQSATQDMKDAGHDTKEAAKKTGKAAKKTTNKAAKDTKKGAKKVEDKTAPSPNPPQ